MVAPYLGIEGGFDGFYNFVGHLIENLKIPKNLTELGVENPTSLDLDRIVDLALKDPSAAGNPRELDAKNTRALLEECF